MAVCQAVNLPRGEPLSQASQLPQLCRVFEDRGKRKGPVFRGIGPFLMLLFESAAFECEGNALAATDAECRQAFLGIALDHFMQ